MIPKKHKKNEWVFVLLGILLIPFIFLINESYPEAVSWWEGFRQEGIVVRPVNPTSLYPHWLYYEIAPGEKISDEFWLVNKYKEERELTLGTADADGVFDDPDTFELNVREDKNYSGVGQWLRFAKEQDTLVRALKPRFAEKIPFTLSVPAETEPGYYLGAFYADQPPVEQTSAPLKVQIRSGLRVLLYVTDVPRSMDELVKKPPLISKRTLLLSGILTLFFLFFIIFSQTDWFSKRFNW